MKKVLIVDDNEQNLYMLEVLLAGNNFLVERAANGAEALEKAREAPPDMVVSDILMPVMDGFALCRAWKTDKRLKSIPFVFYTATYTDRDDESFAISLGADRFITKPIMPGKLLNAIMETLNGAGARKPAAPEKPVRNAEYYKGYNAALIRKLEDKMIEIEAANRILQADIAERKRAEEERRRLEEQIMQARKMESVGRLAGGIAHDFNNILAVIRTSAELGMLRLKPGDPLQSTFKDILSAVKRSTELTRRLLAFARRQPISPRVIDLNETTAGMLNMLRRLIGDTIEIVWKPGEGLWPVRIDPAQIDQILANLCVNSRDAITGPGRIVIETGNASIEADTPGRQETLPPGAYVRLSVRDNGCGISKEVLEHIFEPFFTTKDVGKGTGLGLATVYGAVKQNGGFINVASEPGQGAAFDIYLPRSESAPESAPPPTRPARQCPRGTETILMAEDDIQLVELIKASLEHLGYRVIAAAGPGEAISQAEQHPGPIHLLVTDMAMPVMNGKDLAREIQKRHPETKILFTSGYSQDIFGSGGFLERETCFIQKPYSIDDLACKVREALDKKQSSEQHA